MSNPESFIDEVTEEVRRDKLFALFRRYGWIGLALVVAIVGGAAWSEWQKSQNRARAQGFGDAAIAALSGATPAERVAALQAVPATGEQATILQLLLATDPENGRAGALAALEIVAADAALPEAYRDLAVLRRVMLLGAEAPVADRRAALDGIAVAGRPFRSLALEQLAYLLVEEAKTDEAIEALRALTQDQEASPGLRSRAEQMILALGGAPTEQG